jgi:hypothetical protein
MLPSDKQIKLQVSLYNNNLATSSLYDKKILQSFMMKKTHQAMLLVFSKAQFYCAGGAACETGKPAINKNLYQFLHFG